jgi:aminopeptidase N
MPRPFSPPGTPHQYLPDRPVSMEHVRLELELDLPGQRLAGLATLTLRARRDEVKSLELHAVDMKIEAVTVDGAAADGYHYDGQRLFIDLEQPHARGTRLTVAVKYRATPRRGLYFVQRPAAAGGGWECWTQGQDEDSRHYWPGLDIPAEKATSEVICVAPRGLFLLSNGELRERTDLDEERTRWHYVLDFPHSGYLVTLACGAFVEIADRAPATGVDVFYFVPPGREDDARRSYGRTPAMIDFFSKQIGLRYPHARYSQIAVHDFIFGGMENTTATTLTSESLLDERAALDHDVEALVAHELAHQWWGDLLTCREWPEAWLNEGFATYFEYVWREATHGRDEADAELLNDADSYFDEAGKYLRPVACRQYLEPIEIFDRHLYEKGGRILHMLRQELGDPDFWRALNHYAETHARRSVETRDLARAIEDATGRNLDGFFEQWINTAGHPEIAGSWKWDPDRKLGQLRLEQKQAGDRPFTFDVEVRFDVGGQEWNQTLKVRERIQTFEVPLPARPEQVIFDPGDVILKKMELEKPRPLWLRQLAEARLGVDRLLAARALGEQPAPESSRALAEALSNDPFWAVRAAAARALGQLRGPAAKAALIGARTEAHPKVRRSVAAALGEFKEDRDVGGVLARWAEDGDPSYFVEATAGLSLGRVRAQEALTVLPKLLARPAWGDVIRARALEGLGALGDERAWPLVEAAYVPASTFQARRAAVSAMVRLGDGTPLARRARERVEQALDDNDFRVRAEAAAGLATLGDGRSLPALERAMRAELDGRAKRRMREALAELTDKGRPAEQARKLSEEVERMRSELGELRTRLDAVERAASEGNGREPSGPRKRLEEKVARRPRPPARRGSKPRRRTR